MGIRHTIIDGICIFIKFTILVWQNKRSFMKRKYAQFHIYLVSLAISYYHSFQKYAIQIIIPLRIIGN